MDTDLLKLEGAIDDDIGHKLHINECAANDKQSMETPQAVRKHFGT